MSYLAIIGFAKSGLVDLKLNRPSLFWPSSLAVAKFQVLWINKKKEKKKSIIVIFWFETNFGSALCSVSLLHSFYQLPVLLASNKHIMCISDAQASISTWMSLREMRPMYYTVS